MRAKKISSTFLLAALIFVFIVKSIAIDGIVSRPLNDYDEARYAEVSKNMILTGSYMIPLAGGPDEPRDIIVAELNNGEHLYPFFWKPPLTMWLQAISMNIFGINEFANRFPSFLASIGLLIVLFMLMKHYGVSTHIAVVLISIFMFTFDLSYIATQGTTDALLAFLGATTILLAGRKTHRAHVAAGICTGLALLTKSIAALWIPMVYLAFLYVNKNMSGRRIIQYLLITGVIAVPWFLFIYAKFGDIFIERHFLLNFSGGAAGGQNFAPLQWYTIYMLDRWKPLIFLTPLITYLSFKKILAKDQKYLVILFWISAILIPFSLSKAKVWWYIYPIWPAFLLLCGLLIEELRRKAHLTTLAILALLLSIAPYWQLSTYHIPLKQFAAFVFLLIPILLLTEKSKRVTSRVLLICFSVVLIATTFFHWRKNLTKNPTWNTEVKILAKRNQGLTKISVLGMPYESALYYFNSGNVRTDVASYDQDRYLILKDGWVPLDLAKFTLIDKEGSVLLYKNNSH